MSTPRNLRSSIAKIAGVSTLAAAAAISFAPIASADTSDTTNGCYAWYGSTTANGHCSDPYVTQTGNYRVYGVCAYENDSLSGWNYFEKGAYAVQWGGVECTFNMRKAYIVYH
ncbi:hypothetical protein ACWD4B_22255 [Streptomyces sp. NPDC002536]